MKKNQGRKEKELLVQNSPVAVTLEEYITQEWFRMVEEDEDEEEELYPWNVIVVDMECRSGASK